MRSLYFLALILGLNALSLEAQDFLQVKPQNEHPEFMARMKKALVYLKVGEHPIAAKTYNYIISGKVKVDLISDLTYQDYLRVLKDFEREGTETYLKAKHYQELSTNEKVRAEFESKIDGYMWEDRIYVSANLKPYELAQTLVHEVNHVINESHIAYYESDYQAFMGEYRAFYVEKLFTGEKPQTKKEHLELKQYVAILYGFSLRIIDKLPNLPTGKLLP